MPGEVSVVVRQDRQAVSSPETYSYAAHLIPMSHGNGHSRLPIDVIDLQFPQVVDIPPPPPPQRPLWPAIVMFLLTVITTLAVGSQLV